MLTSLLLLVPHSRHSILNFSTFPLSTPCSVTLGGMARIFGLSAAFLDRDLSRFIANGRLSAKIDAVAGIVETSRPDAKSAQYAQVLKTGDSLLNKVQKLSRVVAL